MSFSKTELLNVGLDGWKRSTSMYVFSIEHLSEAGLPFFGNSARTPRRLTTPREGTEGGGKLGVAALMVELA